MSDSPARFVVLRHECPAGYKRASHWDLMLEHDGVLVTWALECLLQRDIPLKAERLADHRLAYLEFEGEFGGNRGTVTRWDCGSCQWESYDDRELVARLSGEKLVGRLTACANDANAQWTLTLEAL